MRAIRSRAMAGVAVASLTMMKRSPMITPELGSPSAVYAQQCGDSCSNVIFLSARSAWLANALLMGEMLLAPARRRAGRILRCVIDYGLCNATWLRSHAA